MDNVDLSSSYNYFKNLCIRKNGDEIGLQKYIRLTKRVADKTNKEIPKTITYRARLNESLIDLNDKGVNFLFKKNLTKQIFSPKNFRKIKQTIKLT